MSTKIHHGYQLVDVPGGNVLACAPLLRSVMVPVYQSLYFRVAAEVAVGALDAARFGVDHVEDTRVPVRAVDTLTPVVVADLFLNDIHHHMAKSGERSPHYDMNMQVTFLPDPNPGDAAAAYALLFTERAEYRDAWQALDWVEPFPYWNNTDPPEGVSPDDWKARQVVWERVVGWDPPAVRGLSWSLLGGVHPCSAVTDPGRLLDVVPSREQRARRVASSMAAGSSFSELRADIDRIAPGLVGDLPAVTLESLVSPVG